MKPWRPLRILIVEDEGIIAMDIEATAEDEGHTVVGWATSADEAIDLFDRVSPDLVFLDVQLLNGSSGIDVARYFQSRGETKFVYLTANPSKVESHIFGGIGILAKPFTSTKLAGMLRYLQQGVFDPPPSLALPLGLTLGPGFSTSWTRL